MDFWTACVRASDRLMEAVDRIPGERSDRYERYRSWSMNPATAEGLLKTLLTLGIHALVLEAAPVEHHDSEWTVGRLPLADIEESVTKRPSHELLAGLPRLGESDQLRVNAVKVLIYDNASALHLARLCQMVRITLLNVAARLPATEPTCQDVRNESELE